METKTSDAKETYKYWTGTDIPRDIEPLNGQYWQSSHFTKEYILYLKFKPKREWWDSFLKENSLAEHKGSWNVPDDAPPWFKPPRNSARYSGRAEFDQGSRYFHDAITGISYIYEIQL